MTIVTAKEIRNQFIDFFKEKDHRFIPSSPVVPSDDPTLLFTNAGMNQFKPIFLETAKPTHPRAVNSQKCIRVSGKHNDLEEVGHDTYHHTFFEMLGNWSFGDYYKPEAIAWAWELFTKIWGLPKDRLYATVYKDDDESFQLWKKITDIPADHVYRFGEKDNFWEMGDTGPCGPCSEIHIDLTADGSGGKMVNAGSPEVIELWNLVFIQYNRQPDGSLKPLPSKHVDTGAGFERITRVLQNKTSNYDIDIFNDIIRGIENTAKQTYAGHPNEPAFRVIADHIRMLTFSVTDGAIPGNEGRGYVLRRILRRAAMYGRKIGMHEPFIYRLVGDVVNTMGDAFPEIRERKEYTEKVIRTEEENFNRTLDRGIEMFEDIAGQIVKKGLNVIPGDQVFKLYDTYGFPFDLTRIMAEERSLKADEESARQEMEKQKQRSREEGKKKFVAAGIEWTVVQTVPGSKFLGYDLLSCDAKILKYSRDGSIFQFVADRTPFYAESGGQVGDKGIAVISGRTVEIWDTQKIGDDSVHFADDPGELTIDKDTVVQMNVSTDLRKKIVKNHSATHLVHSALRKVLGDHVQQSGSVVEPYRLRFDYSHFEKMTDEQIFAVERIVNEKIRENEPLKHHRDTPIEEARRMGALSFFGDKYGDKVNVVQFGDFSKEFCGGTHVSSTGEIGLFRIVIETSVAAGLRRIEAVTGDTAENIMNGERMIIDKISNMFSCKTEDLVSKVETLFSENRRLEKSIAETQLRLQSFFLDDLVSRAKTVNGFKVVSEKIELPDGVELKDIGDRLRDKLKSGVGVLATVRNDQLMFVCVVTEDLTKTYQAGTLIKEVAKVAGGSGGGRPHLATAGAKEPGKIKEALEKIFELIK